MESKSAFRSAPLLDRALRIASQRAQTYDSLAESLGVTPEDAALYWFSINSLRRGLGHDLPPLSASARSRDRTLTAAVSGTICRRFRLRPAVGTIPLGTWRLFSKRSRSTRGSRPITGASSTIRKAAIWS